MDEFSLIARYFDQPNMQAMRDNSALIVGIGDDCGVLAVPAAKDLVFSLDTLVEGVHFLKDTAPADIAWRLMGAAVSDLAAMGAEPNSFTLALTLPELSKPWLAEFSHNLAGAADTYGITLCGGDTTKGPLTLSVQVQGFVNKGCALLRSGAKEGDLICVSGSLGDSRAGLSLLPLSSGATLNASHKYLLDRFYRPTPRIATGLLISEYASACIDISDGLLADLNHILKRSGVGAKINADSIPMSQPLKQIAGDLALDWALTGGEDFELCFTIPAAQWPYLKAQLDSHDVTVSTIGEICEGNSMQIFYEGQWQPVAANGFNHFSNND